MVFFLFINNIWNENVGLLRLFIFMLEVEFFWCMIDVKIYIYDVLVEFWNIYMIIYMVYLVI